MESQHASLGRRKLKEVCQKRASERLSKSSPAPDLARVSSSSIGPFGEQEEVGLGDFSVSVAPSVNRKKSESGNRLAELDVSDSFFQIKDLLRANGDLQTEKERLLLEMAAKVVENEFLLNLLNDLLQNPF